MREPLDAAMKLSQIAQGFVRAKTMHVLTVQWHIEYLQSLELFQVVLN